MFGILVRNDDIVACQRGGVSDESPWLRAATRHRELGAKIRTDYGPVLLRQGEPGTSLYIQIILSVVDEVDKLLRWPRHLES